MTGPFRKLALAIAFSPRIQALLAETARLKFLWNAELCLIHVGSAGAAEEQQLNNYLTQVGLSGLPDVHIFWEKGNTTERILARCRKENVDLLIAGALKKEKLLQYYLGSIGRAILRRADCSVLTLIAPSPNPVPFHNILVNAENSNYVREALDTTLEIARSEKANWLHVVRTIKMYGLAMSAAAKATEEEYERFRQSLVQQEIENVERLLGPMPEAGPKINIKIVSGKSGFALSKFAAQKNIQLLVVGAPPRRFSILDRMFPHDVEYLLKDMPCNLLIINPRKIRKQEGNRHD
ncbi:MAG TPA: universal stress protein [Ohtaekwangia sp.]|nr:universal stress protein [Ohtaekwangia sp.]